MATEGCSPLFLARGDEDLAGDLRHGDAVGPQGPGVGGHVVDDFGPTAVPAALAGRRLAFEGLLPDVLALGLLEGAGEEFQLDVVVAQVLGDGQQLGAAARALHLVHREHHALVRDGLPDGAGEVHRLDELRPGHAPGADLLRDDGTTARLSQGVEPALELLLGGTATGVPSGSAVGGDTDFELGAELGDGHEARSVALRATLPPRVRLCFPDARTPASSTPSALPCGTDPAGRTMHAWHVPGPAAGAIG
nr:hypothetical protein [Streptomyces sp. TRM70350]